VAWPAHTLAGAARTGCTVTVCMACVVAWLATAHRWMESGGCAGKGGWRRGSPEQRRVGGAVGWRGAVAVAGGGACTVVTDDIVLVLHHGGRERKVRWGPRMTERGAG
jgi:hypothetical protein